MTNDLSALGKFGLIYADPPWSYRDLGHTRRIDRQYSTMCTGNVAALPVADVSLPDAVLFLWVTAPLLPDGLEVLNTWGFKYCSNMVWDKEIFGMGHYARIQHEHLLIGRKGRPGIAAEGARNIPSVIRARRGKHSAKPVEAYEIIERMYPALSKIELFARARRPGWASWGDEVEEGWWNQSKTL
jgi:N6-adenosine-specific RNA methylase IME4